MADEDRSAGLANPALLARHKEREDWGVVLPALSVLASDPDNITITISETSIENTRDRIAPILCIVAISFRLNRIDSRKTRAAVTRVEKPTTRTAVTTYV